MRSIPTIAASAVSLTIALSGCSHARARSDHGSAAPPAQVAVQLPAVAASAPPSDPRTGRMTLHFYDVGQALAVLVDLPDGRHILTDAGDEPRREGCGEVCVRAHAHLVDRLMLDLGGAPLDMLWITHPHSDHVGGAPDVLARVPVRLYVDNGRDSQKPDVRRARQAALEAGARVDVVDPDHATCPLPSTPSVKLSAVVPPRWPRGCAEDENECSIVLRIDHGASSVLLTGDAEREEEARLDPGAVTLLQVGHHGSDTSTSASFLAKVRPRYAIISAGRPGEGINRDYCHPRAEVVERLSRALGPADSPAPVLTAFGGARCDPAAKAMSGWHAVTSSDRLWATERDGDVVLTTTGDGRFQRMAR